MKTTGKFVNNYMCVTIHQLNVSHIVYSNFLILCPKNEAIPTIFPRVFV